jgi:hypothetical protein
MKKIIHVNRQHIAMNAKDGGSRPTLTCKTYKKNWKGFKVEIDGPSVLMDADHCDRKQLNCGARVWIETTAPVRVDGEAIP